MAGNIAPLMALLQQFGTFNQGALGRVGEAYMKGKQFKTQQEKSRLEMDLALSSEDRAKESHSMAMEKAAIDREAAGLQLKKDQTEYAVRQAEEVRRNMEKAPNVFEADKMWQAYKKRMINNPQLNLTEEDIGNDPEAFISKGLSYKDRITLELSAVQAGKSKHAPKGLQPKSIYTKDGKFLGGGGWDPNSGLYFIYDKDHNKLPAPVGAYAKETQVTETKLGDTKDLGEYLDQGRQYLDLISTFNPSYSGKGLKFVGDMDNWIQERAGDKSGQAMWWKQMYALNQAIRHDLYGAVLTPTEQRDFEKITITPGTHPELVKQFLVQKYLYAYNKVQDWKNVQSAQGVSNDQLSMTLRNSAHFLNEIPKAYVGSRPIYNLRDKWYFENGEEYAPK